MIDDVYIYSEDTAYRSGELDLYYENRKLNIACAEMINKVICGSNTDENHYTMRTAVTTVIAEYGTARLLWVLANIVQYNGSDSRFSRDNKDWAMALAVPKDAPFCKFVVQTNPVILYAFIRTAREICEALHNE